MLLSRRISLNALRVFLLAARHLSLKRAAEEIGVSPGAVSQQIRQLEDRLGVPLFTRSNNAIALTTAGAALLHQAAPGLRAMEAALDLVMRREGEMTVQVSATFATRWLIPRLEAFRSRNPGVRIRLETQPDPGVMPEPGSDVSIVYYRAGDVPTGAEILFDDLCRPYAAPDLVRQSPVLAELPVLQAAEGNWDWRLWMARAGLPMDSLTFVASFDLDDAALGAAIAGMGATLSSAPMVAGDVATGRLMAIPETPEVSLGAYVIHRSRASTGLQDRFVSWMRQALGPHAAGRPT